MGVEPAGPALYTGPDHSAADLPRPRTRRRRVRRTAATAVGPESPSTITGRTRGAAMNVSARGVDRRGRGRGAGGRGRGRGATRRSLVVTSVVAVVLGILTWVPGPAVAAPVGNGFVVNAADLGFILKQIQIAERHAATLTPANSCRTQLGTAPDQIPNELTS